MSIGIDGVKVFLFQVFLHFLSSFFEFGRQVCKNFTKKSHFPEKLRNFRALVSFGKRRFFSICNSLFEVFIDRVPLMVIFIPLSQARMRNGCRKHKQGQN